MSRRKIIEASLKLPKTPVMGGDGFPVPDSVGAWLTRIKLKDYEPRFIHNGYDNIDRVRVIWELELVTVSFIWEKLKCSLVAQKLI